MGQLVRTNALPRLVSRFVTAENMSLGCNRTLYQIEKTLKLTVLMYKEKMNIRQRVLYVVSLNVG